MKCPMCSDTDLLQTERQGVEIEYCPSCRGVWLHRGGLDVIVERSREGSIQKGSIPNALHGAIQGAVRPRQESHDHGHDHDHGHGHDHWPDEKRNGHGHDNHGYDSHDSHSQKKGGFFGSLFGGD